MSNTSIAAPAIRLFFNTLIKADSSTMPASDGSAYREYALTQKGRELFPVIVALRQ